MWPPTKSLGLSLRQLQVKARRLIKEHGDDAFYLDHNDVDLTEVEWDRIQPLLQQEYDKHEGPS
jgi:hypothetical protein